MPLPHLCHSIAIVPIAMLGLGTGENMRIIFILYVTILYDRRGEL